MYKTIIFHSPLAKGASADELDVLQEADFFSKGLTQLGYKAIILPFDYDLKRLMEVVRKIKPVFVVNLVETLFTSGKLVHIAPFMLEHFNIPFTGCSGHAMYLSSHKVLSKQHMLSNHINTPDFFSFSSLKEVSQYTIQKPFLIKSVWEHASYGMDESLPLLFNNKVELLDQFTNKTQPENYFCEEYIHGREFNLSLLEGSNGAEVLPPAEIRFDYPPTKARILGYKAKWEKDSFEYKNTNRTFDFAQSDDSLLNELKATALKCWNIFELRGYARVDFRIDEQGKIYVLEINANPCISEDSGFVAAAHQAGLNDTEVVKRIIMHLHTAQ